MLNPKILQDSLSYSKIWIAYSGGVDSQVLLNLCAEFRAINPELSLKAVHIHHGISQHADVWVNHCQQVCMNLNIPLEVVKVQLTRRNELGLEAAAREERYRVFADLIAENELLLTAHNANDQAETLLLQLLRGAGPKGLSAMPIKKPLGRGFLWRPLLAVSRAEIEGYAKSHALKWIEDESNLVEDYPRNFIRHQIMPKLLELSPAALETLARSAAHCAESSRLLEELAAEDLNKIKTENAHCLHLQLLKQFSTDRQTNVLRYWFKILNFALPETRHLAVLFEQINAKHDAQPLVCWADVECRRFDDCLYVMRPLKPISKLSFAWPEEKELLRAELGSEKIAHIESTLKKVSNQTETKDIIILRFRQGGERCKIQGRQGTHELKKLFQEWKIPPWERERTPLIYINDVFVGAIN